MQSLSTNIQHIFTDESQAKIIVQLLTGRYMKPDAALRYLNKNIGIGEIAEVQQVIEQYNKKLSTLKKS